MATQGAKARAGPGIEARAGFCLASLASRRENRHQGRCGRRQRSAPFLGCVRHPDGCFRNPDGVSELRTEPMAAAHDPVVGRLLRCQIASTDRVALARVLAGRAHAMASPHRLLERRSGGEAQRCDALVCRGLAEVFTALCAGLAQRWRGAQAPLDGLVWLPPDLLRSRCGSARPVRTWLLRQRGAGETSLRSWHTGRRSRDARWPPRDTMGQ
jgi:hypothetical protein